MIIIPVIISYFIMKYAIKKAIMDYAKIVDDVLFQKDQKIEDLEYRISELTSRVEDLESRPTNKSYWEIK